MASCIVERSVSGSLDVLREGSGGEGERACLRKSCGLEAACVVRAIICSTGIIRGGRSGKIAFISVFVLCMYAVVIMPLWDAFVPQNFVIMFTVILVGVLIALCVPCVIFRVLVGVNSVGIGITSSEVSVMVAPCFVCVWRGSISCPSVRSACACFASVFCSFPCDSFSRRCSSHSRAQYPVSCPSDLTDCGRLIPAASDWVVVCVNVERKDLTEGGSRMRGDSFVTLIAASNFAEPNVWGVFAAQCLHSAKFLGDGRHLMITACCCGLAGRMRHSVPSHLCIVAGFSNIYPCRYCRDEFGPMIGSSLNPMSARSLPSLSSLGRRDGGVLYHSRDISSDSLWLWRRYATHTRTDMLPTGICSGLSFPSNSLCSVGVSDAYEAIVRGFAFFGKVRICASMSGNPGGHTGCCFSSVSVEDSLCISVIILFSRLAKYSP